MCLHCLSEDHLPVYFNKSHCFVLVTDHWEFLNNPFAVQVDQLSSNSVDLRAASGASGASLVTTVEVVQLSGHNHQNRLAPSPSAGLDNSDSTFSDNSLGTSSKGLTPAAPEAPADLPSELLESETELGVAEGIAEEASGDETPREHR